MSAHGQDQALLQALVSQKYFRLYSDNSAFCTSIDFLVRLLPYWVDGLAAQAGPGPISHAQMRDLMGTKQITLDELHAQGIG